MFFADRRIVASIPLLLAVAAPCSAQADRLYGRVHTEDGEVLEGYLRWDRNEGSWVDFLDGAKELPWEHLREAERLDAEFARRRARERSLVVGDLRIAWDEDPEDEPWRSSSAIRFGHLASLVVGERGRAHLSLVSGQRLDFVPEGSDLGGGFRGLVVEPPGREPVELPWRELTRVDFVPAPAGAPPPMGERLHGTLRTRSGRELTGFVAWDLDEILTTDVLDGDERGVRHEIPFGRIAAVERESSRAARVVLADGRTLVLEGTNDVNASNRGIEIADPHLGRAVVRWNAFASLRFHPPSGEAAGGDRLDGGAPLRGRVETAGGATLEGALRWDNDETHTWEVLDGFWGDTELAVELALVREIERVPDHGARVTLRDGRVLELAAASDVDGDNRGLFVTGPAGETVLVRWQELRRVVLER